jgi:cytochrome b involved in lipid metabolism
VFSSDLFGPDNMSKKYTAEEVAKHNVLDGPNKSTWVIYEGKVYDISNFVSEHPGGTEVLADTAGTDITRSFTEIGHSDHARGLMTPMLVGELEGYVPGAKSARRAPVVGNKAPSSESGKPSGGISPALIAVLIVIIAAVAYYAMTSM